MKPTDIYITGILTEKVLKNGWNTRKNDGNVLNAIHPYPGLIRNAQIAVPPNPSVYSLLLRLLNSNVLEFLKGI